MTGLRLWHALALLSVFWAGIYLPGLGNEELKGEEPRRVLPGLEMIRSGNWINPVVAGEAYHRKPPLTNWVTAAGVLALGRVDELAVRLPITLFVLAFACATCLAVHRMAGTDTGFLAGVFILTNIGMMEKGRLAEIEGIYVSLTGLAFAAWFAFAAPRWAVDSPRQRPWPGWLLAGPLLGLAFLAKGPPHLLLFYAVLCGVWWRTGKWRDALHPAHGVGILLAILVALPWFLASSHGGDATVASPAGGQRDMLGELTSRLDPGQLDATGWLLQLFQGPGNYLPWILILLVPAIPPLRRRCGLDASPRLLTGLLAGCLAGYLLIALTPAARARFTLPLMGPAAVATALALVASTRGHMLTRPWRIALRVLPFVVGLAAVALPWVVEPSARAGCVVASVLAIGLVVLVWEGTRRWPEQPVNLAVTSAIVMVAAMALYATGIQSIKARDENLRPTGIALRAALQPDEKAILYRAGLQPWVFYAWGRVTEVPLAKNLPDSLSGPVVLPAGRWPAEQARLEKRYGPAVSQISLPNRWNNKDLLIVRFGGAAARQAP